MMAVKGIQRLEYRHVCQLLVLNQRLACTSTKRPLFYDSGKCPRRLKFTQRDQCWKTSPVYVSAKAYCTESGDSNKLSANQVNQQDVAGELQKVGIGDVEFSDSALYVRTRDSDSDIENNDDLEKTNDDGVKSDDLEKTSYFVERNDVEKTKCDNNPSTDFLVDNVSKNTDTKPARVKSPDRIKYNVKPTFYSSDPLCKSLDPTDFPVQDDITNFLTSKEIPFNEGFTGYHLVCPKFGKLAMKKKKIEQRLYVNAKSGYFVCNACKVSGYWRYLKDNIVCQKAKKASRTRVCFKDVRGINVEAEETPWEVQKQLETTEHFSTLSSEQFDNILAIFDWHGIERETFVKYGVRCRVEGNKYYVIFPIQSMRNGATSAVRVYAGSVSDEDDVKISVDTYPRNSDLKDLFGWQHRPTGKTLVITSSEVNAMVISQTTNTTALALRSISQLPLEVLPPLEEFTKIILWIGTDIHAWDSTNVFAKKLNEKRCCIFRLNRLLKLPLQLLQEDANIKLMLEEARPISHKDIVKFSHIRGEVYSELAHLSQVAGVQWQKYTSLNSVLKGHRRGELTVLTGPTGSGKTTFVSDYSLDLCMQGVNTLWGSFEINNVKLAKMMLRQFSGKDLTKHLEDFDQVANDFANLPMYFMTYFGQEHVDKVLEVMTHAVYVHDISHVVIDNLQFMMGMDYTEINRFMKQDRIVAMFRQFATEKNCHVTLITHPRKVDDTDLLSTSSIFGSAKLTQEADNVLLIQKLKLNNSLTAVKFLQLQIKVRTQILGCPFNDLASVDEHVATYNTNSVDWDKPVENLLEDLKAESCITCDSKSEASDGEEDCERVLTFSDACAHVERLKSYAKKTENSTLLQMFIIVDDELSKTAINSKKTE